MQNRHLAMRTLLWFIAVYHVAAGLLLNCPREWILAVARPALNNAALKDIPEVFFFLHPLGIYLIVFGILMGVAAWNPVKNRAIISVGVILFALRIVQRIATGDEFQSLLGVSPARNMAMIGVVAVFGIALAFFRYQLYREMHSGLPPQFPEKP